MIASLFSVSIPAQYYSPIFYNALLFLIIIASFKLIADSAPVYYSNKNKSTSSIILLIILLFFIGLRPISVYFGDMGVYYSQFTDYERGENLYVSKDIFWHMFVNYCSKIMTSKVFFFTCTALYILPIYLACKRWFNGNMYILFLMFIASFSFFAYGTNGIRNGIATSLFMYGLVLDKKLLKYGIFSLALLFHGSIIIPFAAYIITLYYKKPKYYLFGWLAAIPLSIVLGSFWEQFFTTLGFGNQGLDYLTDNQFADQFAYTGFRWDFVIYSSVAVFAGYYFIIKKKFQDKHYHQIFNIYVTVNAFWILIIRASFSNRFAYLSWFLMAIIIFYPFFKQRFFKNQNIRLAAIMLLYFMFTFYMNL
jgi:hypothetical protein